MATLPSGFEWRGDAAPYKSGVYVWEHLGEIVYVGISQNLRTRLATHRSGPLWKFVCGFTEAPVFWWASVPRGELRRIEADLLRTLRPRLNGIRPDLRRPRPDVAARWERQRNHANVSD